MRDVVSPKRRLVIYVIPPSRRVRFAPRAGHSPNARVYEYTACGAAENKSLEIKTPRQPLGATQLGHHGRGVVSLLLRTSHGRGV
jgi:hypothetical protein